MRAYDPATHDDPVGVGTDESLVLPTLLRTRAETIGDRPFLVEVTGRAETYRETHESSLRWAGLLRGLAVEPGEQVAVLLDPCLEAHHVWLGCAALGARDAPLNPAYRGHLLQYTLNVCRARVLVTRSSFLPVLAEVEEELVHLERVVLVDDGDGALTRVQVHRRPELTPAPLPDLPPPGSNAVASLLFTSGTTGPSKGVLVRWGQITVGSELSPLGLFDEDSASYCPYPVYHLTGKIPLVSAARTGGRVVIAERYSTSSLWRHIREHRCSSMGMLGAIAQFVASADFAPDDARSLRYVTMSPALPTVDEISARLGVVVGTGYGSTEAGWPLVNRTVTNSDHLSCGRIRPGYELRIVDEHGRDVEVGGTGELLVRAEAPQLMSAGYFEMPEKTAEAWAEGWFHTGDAFRCDAEGRYYFVDRVKDALRRRGENISSFEVETYVDQHPDVDVSAAVAVPSEFGEDEVKVVVVCRPGASVTPAELRAWLEPRMPKFMLPRYLAMVDALPTTDTGKVKKAELRAAGVDEGTWDAGS
jgi:carnitine-CoA ligase